MQHTHDVDIWVDMMIYDDDDEDEDEDGDEDKDEDELFQMRGKWWELVATRPNGFSCNGMWGMI